MWRFSHVGQYYAVFGLACALRHCFEEAIGFESAMVGASEIRCPGGSDRRNGFRNAYAATQGFDFWIFARRGVNRLGAESWRVIINGGGPKRDAAERRCAYAGNRDRRQRSGRCVIRANSRSA